MNFENLIIKLIMVAFICNPYNAKDGSDVQKFFYVLILEPFVEE